jgi:hypothetical protein
MNFPTSSIGLPQSLKYDLPPSFSDSARAYSVNVAPDGITQVVGPALVQFLLQTVVLHLVLLIHKL